MFDHLYKEEIDDLYEEIEELEEKIKRYESAFDKIKTLVNELPTFETEVIYGLLDDTIEKRKVLQIIDECYKDCEVTE